MKAGKTIQELAAEITRQNKAKVDYLVNTASVHMEPCGGAPLLHVLDDKGEDLVEPLDVRQTAHEQIGTYLNIPRKYYERMRAEDPELLSYNVNRWFSKQPEQRMLRTIDGHARAFLSKRYRRIDNYDVATSALPIIAEMAGAEFLRRENYSADEYYDIAALGFLRAVNRWFSDMGTRRCRFSTIAWSAMRQSIASYRRAETRRRETERKYLDNVPTQPDLLEETEYNILLHDLAAKAGHGQYELARLRMQGYSVAEVAEKQGMPPHRVRKLLKEMFQVYLRLYT